MAPLNALDAELEALQARLRALEEDSDADASTSASESASTRRKRKKKEKKEKKEKREREGKRRREETSASEDEIIRGGDDLPRIEPLPRALLPEGNDYKGKGGREAFLGGARAGRGGASGTTSEATGTVGVKETPRNELERRLAARADRPRCEACGMDFTSDAQYAEHCRGKKHLSKVRAATGGDGAGGGGGGGRRYVKPPPGPHCDLCRKMFTSEAQKKEHFDGKWHKMRVRGELPPSNKPYS